MTPRATSPRRRLDREADLPAMQLLGSHPFGPLLGLLLLLGMAAVVLAMIYVPWQQSVTGQGTMGVFQPDDRPQEVTAQISGRLTGWDVAEGDRVRRGQVLCRLQEVDPKFLDPDLTRNLQAQREAMARQRALAAARGPALEAQRAALRGAYAAALPAASQKIGQAEDRRRMARESVRAASQNLETARLNLERIQTLHAEGLKSTRDLELSRQTWVATQVDLERARAAEEVSDRDVAVAGLERQKLEADLDTALARLADEQIKAAETVAKIDTELQKLVIELANLKGRAAQREIVAPVDGRMVRVHKVGTGDQVKAGDPLATVVPDTRDQAAEIYLDDFDAPLVAEGRPVRLMFDGFPAVPFVAFPWAAVGTYAGVVKVVDAVDDGTGRFRLLIVPDEAAIRGGEAPWPPSDRLRPGTQAMGWVMLDQVPLYWEVWRRLNAFPPFPREAPKAGQGSSKKGNKEKAAPKPVLGK